MSNDITYFIVNPNKLFSYLKNDFNTNSKMIRKYLDNNLDEIFIEKLLKLLKLYLIKYDSPDIILNPKFIKNKHYYFLQIAKEEAKKSLLNHQHGCVIVYKNKIVATGHNKALMYNNNNFRSIHAEKDAIIKLTKNTKFQNKSIRNNCSLYVVRIRQNTHELKHSKPCKNCIKSIKENHIGLIYYSTESTFVDDLIGGFIKECMKIK
tara:strand:- start:10 stop:630 length:621 start_codon:yes stop_codon:yes gene_type:complete